MADYAGGFDPTLGYYGGMSGAETPYLPLGQSELQLQGGGAPPLAGAQTGVAPTNPFSPTPIVNSTGLTRNPNDPPPGVPTNIPDPKNPGYDTAGFLLGSTYDPATGTLTVKRPDGSTAVTQVDPKTGLPVGGTPTSPFGTRQATPPTPPTPPPTPNTGVYNPEYYAPFTRPAPVFQKPPPFKAPTLEEAAAQPGYQFGLQQGEQALQQSAAAKGLLRTGGTLKGILDYGRNAATQNYAGVLGQNLGIYNTNLESQYKQPFEAEFATYIADQNRFRQNQQDPFSKYLQLLQLANPNV